MRDIKTIIRMLKQLKYIMNKEQRKESLRLIFIILIGALFELLGISSVLPLIEAIIHPEKIVNSKLWGPIFSFFDIGTNKIVFVMGLVVAVIFIIKNLYLSYSAYKQAAFRCKFQKDLSINVLESYMHMPYINLTEVNSFKVIRAVGTDIDGVYLILENLFKFLSELLTMILIGVYITMSDWIMASGVIILAIFSLLFITITLKHKINQLGQEQRILLYLRNAYVNQAIIGNKEIRVMSRTNSFMKTYEDVYERLRGISVKYNLTTSLPERIIETVCIVGIMGVISVRVMIGMDLSTFVPVLGAFAMAAFRILPCVSRMAGNINMIVFNRAALEAIYNNLNETFEISNISSSDNSVQNEKINFDDIIEVDNIVWKYKNSTKNTLDGVSLKINKGESIAIIGSSGAGKTTLADIILGLLTPVTGDTKVDGRSIYSMQEGWSRMIGYVPQSTFLIDSSIRENITFGLESKEIDDELVFSAIKQAQLEEFVNSLPDGIDTVVGERGVKISGGQRQRIAIARALYYNPDIIVFDEATSSLDTDTEQAVMEAIERLYGNKTIIIIAHRLTTIKNCDKIYEVQGGKIFERKKEDVFKDF